MPPRLAICLLALAVAACQSHNPYTAESVPLPAAPSAPEPGEVRGAYPAAPLDFSRYRSWSWRGLPAGTGSLAPEELQEIVADALEQRGLRPAADATPAALQVSAAARTETRERQVYDDYGSYYGHGRYGHDYGLWGSRPLVRTYREDVVVVRIELFDGASGNVVWSNQAEARSAGSRAERKDAVRTAVQRALDDYPPR